MSQGLDVKSGATSDNRQFSARENLANLLASEAREVRSVKGFLRREKPDQMVRNRTKQPLLRLRSKDLYAPIDLEGIRTNDFAVEPGCQLDGERSFADPGGSGNNDRCPTAQNGDARRASRRRPSRR